MNFVIFDVDGTLTNTYYADDDCFKRTLDAVLPDHNLSNYWEGCAHATDSAVADFVYNRLFGRSPNSAEISRLQQTFVRLLQQKQVENPAFFYEIPGAHNILSTLKEHENLEVGISTGGWRVAAHFKLSIAGIDFEHAHFMGSDEHHAKLDFTQALIDRTKNTLGRNGFSSITYVGDSVYDFKTAQALGAHFIGVDNKDDGRLITAGAENVIKNFEVDRGKFLELLSNYC